jgi:hypothetical protein
MHIQFKCYSDTKFVFAWWWEGEAEDVDNVRTIVTKSAGQSGHPPDVWARAGLRSIAESAELAEGPVGELQRASAVYFVLSAMGDNLDLDQMLTVEVFIEGQHDRVKIFLGEHVLVH